ncbi:MAG: OmpA family protein [Saprospiraceae bacterium]
MSIYPYCLGLLFIYGPISVKTQTLIRNGSFEAHGEQKCLECNTLYGQYPALVYHWDNAGWGCRLLDKDYKRFSDDNKWKGNPFDKMSPKDGKAMIEMWYLPGCGGKEYMCASYLSARTTESLQVGKLYEAIFWLYIESSKRADPERGKHIGIALLPQNIEYRVAGGGKRLIIPFLPVDTVIYDAWYQVKWRVRPLCTSNYLTIGLFADDQWPKSRSFDDLIYFVDKVTLTEIPSQSAVADSSIYYCSRYDPVKLGASPKMDNQILLFQNDAFALTEAHKTVLDSFAVFARKYPDLVFEISGHTDSIGKQNQRLSENRVQSVLEYLTETHKLPSFRFVPLAMSSKEPYRPNSTEEGRVLNRRAEIRQSHLDLPNIFYRNALKAVGEKHYPEAFSFLNKWLIKLNQGYGSGIILQYDPRFEVLHKDKRWSMLKQKIRDKYSKLKYPGYSFLLDSLRLDELSATAALTMVGYQGGLNALSGYIPELDHDLYEMTPLSDLVIQKKCEEHFAALRPILAKTGWPKKSEFGETACNAAFSILLNSGAIVEYMNWLPIVEKSCEAGETPWINYAVLYDRVRLSLGQPQRYLTDLRPTVDGGLKPWEGDENTVNEYRAKIGLPLLSMGMVEAMKKRKP